MYWMKCGLKMFNFICFSTVLYNMISMIMTLSLKDKGVCTDTEGNLSCCFDHKLVEGKCVGCPIGSKIKESVCVPCTTNWYGEYCILQCICLSHQRCDNVYGCVNKNASRHTVSVLSITRSTEHFAGATTNFPENFKELDIKTPTNTIMDNGLLDREIVIYSVVVACIIVILGLSYVVRKYRNKTETEPRVNTVQRTHSNERHSLVDPNLSIYDEIEETMLIETANSNMLPNEISINTDNTSYLDPIHGEDDKRISSDASQSVNNSYLSIHESDQNRSSDESDKNDDTKSYLHPYHTVDEDWKEKTHQYDITHVSNKDVDDSSDSSTHMITDAYLNPYQPLNEDRKHKSHSYEALVTVHQCQLSLPSISTDELTGKDNDDHEIMTDNHKSAAYLHSCRSFKKDAFVELENCQKPTSDKPSSNITKFKQQIQNIKVSTDSKQKMNDDILVSEMDGISEISAVSRNVLDKSKESIIINHISTNEPACTQRENALVSVV